RHSGPASGKRTRGCRRKKDDLAPCLPPRVPVLTPRPDCRRFQPAERRGYSLSRRRRAAAQGPVYTAPWPPASGCPFPGGKVIAMSVADLSGGAASLFAV